jgi:hypothetical protein
MLLSVFFVILNAFNKWHEFIPQHTIEKSLLYKPVSELAPEVFPFLRLDNIAREIKNSLTRDF